MEIPVCWIMEVSSPLQSECCGRAEAETAKRADNRAETVAEVRILRDGDENYLGKENSEERESSKNSGDNVRVGVYSERSEY